MEDTGDCASAAGTLCWTLLLVLDGITLLSLGAALAVDLGAVPNLAKAAFFSILGFDVLGAQRRGPSAAAATLDRAGRGDRQLPGRNE